MMSDDDANEYSENYSDEEFDLDESLDSSQSASVNNKTTRPLINTANDPDVKSPFTQPSSVRSVQSAFSLGNQDESYQPKSVSWNDKNSNDNRNNNSQRRQVTEQATPPTCMPTSTLSANTTYSSDYDNESSATPLPDHILKLREQVKNFTTSGDKKNLLSSIVTLEKAMLLHRVEVESTNEKRKEKARAKIRRAEQRRAKHFKTMSELKQSTALAKLQEEEAKKMLEIAQKDVSKYENLYEQSKLSIKSSTEVIEALNANVKNYLRTIEELKKNVESLGEKNRDLELEKEGAEKRNEIVCEEMEQLRNTLPTKHAEIIKHEEARLDRWEKELEKREGILRQNESNYKSLSAKLMNDIKVESEAMKMDAMNEVKMKEKKLEQRLEEFELERRNFRNNINRCESKLESDVHKIAADRLVVEDRSKKLTEDKNDLIMQKALFAPSMKELKIAEEGLEKRREEIEEAMRKLSVVNGNVKIEAARVTHREGELDAIREELAEKHKMLVKKERELNKQNALISKQVTDLHACRLDLHDQQIAVGTQVGEVRRMLSKTKNIEMRMKLKLGAAAGSGTGAAVDGGNSSNTSVMVTMQNDLANNSKRHDTLETLERACERAAASLDSLSLRSQNAFVTLFEKNKKNREDYEKRLGEAGEEGNEGRDGGDDTLNASTIMAIKKKVALNLTTTNNSKNNELRLYLNASPYKVRDEAAQALKALAMM